MSEGILHGLGAALLTFVIWDSTGPMRWATGTVVSEHFAEGITTYTQIDVGNDVTIPVTTEVPGLWILEIDSAVLGRQSVAVDGNTFKAGQRVYLEYQIGKLTGQPTVQGVYAHTPDGFVQLER